MESHLIFPAIEHSSVEIVFVTFEDSKIYSISDAFNKEQRGFCGESVLFN